MTMKEFVLKSKSAKSPLFASLRTLSTKKEPSRMSAEEAIFLLEPW
mgnify:CR=1 FL=1